MNIAPKYLNPLEEIQKHGTRLPHWQQDGSTFFLTFRLADSIPQAKLGPWRQAREAWLAIHPRPWTQQQERQYHRLFTRQIELWLDQGAGACVLRDSRAARMAGDVLNFFHGQRCRQYAWVVMPNHVHALFSLLGGCRLESLLHSWKSYSANQINELLGRRGTLWQEDYHDRMIRSRRHFDCSYNYILRNPQQARLHEGEFLLYAEAGHPAPPSWDGGGRDAPAP